MNLTSDIIALVFRNFKIQFENYLKGIPRETISPDIT